MNLFAHPDTQEHISAHEEILKLVEYCLDKDLIGLETGRQIKQPIQLIYNRIHAHDLRFVNNLNSLKHLLLTHHRH